MADYLALKNEILNDPLSLGYAGKSDAQVAALMNGASRPTTSPRTVVAAYDVYEAIDPAEWSALSAAQKQTIADVLGMGEVNAAGARTRATFAAAFGAGSVSRANLLALTTVSAARSRAQEVFGVAVTDLDIAKARAS
jgi:plasmid replication initiation protein